MKKVLIASAFLGAFLIGSVNSQAQVRVGVNINIGDQPRWRVPGYDYVDYYYMPDIETYYYVPSRQFIYLSNGRWVFSASLPSRYSGYDLYGGYKVVINRPNAYYYHDSYRVKYPKKHVFVNNGGRHYNNGNHKGWYKKGKKH